MHRNTQILLASRSKQAIEKLARQIPVDKNYRVEIRYIQNGHADPLFGVSQIPDVVVMLLNDQGHHDLEALIELPSANRPPLIVLAENGDATTMRLAMQAGARDFLPGIVTPEELADSIDRIATQFADRDGSSKHQLTAFVNAKGGSGATCIACNVAHMLTAVSGVSTALLSLDFQFESLGQYFDTELRHGLLDVLTSVDSLDDVALDAYMTQHHSGLRMLAPKPEKVATYETGDAALLSRLLDKMAARYEHVVVDMPRRLDPYVEQVILRATRVVLVAQQTLGHLRDASRMLQIFDAYGLSTDQVLVVVNRFDKNAPITIEDVTRALKGPELIMIPSDFKTVAESINLGIPIHEHARGSSVTKALLKLETELSGNSAEPVTGFLGKAFSSILRKETWSRA